MSNSSPESSQWLSVNEDTLFLHDGLLRVTDLVELPNNVENCRSRDNEVVSFDSKNPEELTARLLEICGTKHNAFNTLLEYRLNALKGLWKAKKSFVVNEEQGDRDVSGSDDALAQLKKQDLLKESDQASFSTRISLLLILPLLQSQSKNDPDLCGVTSSVILTCLRDCPPLSLAKEPGDCLNGLENLLCQWLGEETEPTGAVHTIKDRKHIENTAVALIALACARGHVITFIHTVHLLQQLNNIPPLPVAETLTSLLESEGGQGYVSSFLGSKYVLSWVLDDLLGPANVDGAAVESKESSEKDKEKAEQDLGRSITTDGLYLYTTNSFGKGIAKVGTGLHGTLRGYVYNKHAELGPGWLAYCTDMLFLRPQKYDADSEAGNFLQLIDRDTLEVLKIIPKPSILMQPGPCTTVSFCSDGVYCYWLWCPALVQDKNAKGVSVNLNAVQIEKSLEVCLLRPCVSLQKKEETVHRNVNDAILTRLRPLRGSNSAATLMALTGGEALMPTRKDDAPSAGSTNIGIQLKTLMKTPIYCDGNHVIMLTVPVGTAPGGTSRSLFGGGGPISALRSLASNMCFGIKTGFFSARVDLVEAQSCSIGQGTPITGLGACFDIVNNLLWLASGEYVDQFLNPGNLPSHYINSRLGLAVTAAHLSLSDASNLVPISSVTKILLHNVSSMCLHLMQTNQTPGSGSVPVDQPVDLCHLTRVTDVLATAVKDQDVQSAICCLIVLQLIFKTSIIKPARLVVLVSLDSNVDIAATIEMLKEADMSSQSKMSMEKVWHVSACQWRKRMCFYAPEFGDLQSVLDAAKVADVVLFLFGESGVDKYGEHCLTCIIGQGIPSHLFASQGLSSLSKTKMSDAKKKIEKQIEKRFPGEKVRNLDTWQDAQTVWRQLANLAQTKVNFRDNRPYLLAETVEFETNTIDQDADCGTLLVSGYLRGQSLNVNQLVHLPGWGDFQMIQIDEAEVDPYPLIVKSNKDRRQNKDKLIEQDIKESTLGRYVLAKATNPESLQSEVTLDAMEDDETWLPVEETNDKTHVKVKTLKGVSGYQGEWILDMPPSDDDMPASDLSSCDGDDHCMESVQSSSKEPQDVHDDEQEESGDVASDVEEHDDNYDNQMDMDEDKKMYMLMKEARQNEHFPDEVDTPQNVPARVRFARFRGLDNFQSSSWDCNESLPRDYARIYRVSRHHYKRLRKLSKAVTDQNNEDSDLVAEPASFITVYVKDVPKSFIDNHVAGTPVTLFGLFPNEHKMTLVNCLISRAIEFTLPVKSKDTLVFQIGFRRFQACPLFSEHTYGTKFKMERFLPQSGFIVASMFAPIMFAPAPVLVFRHNVMGKCDLVAKGSLLPLDTDRIIVKRVVLTGAPFKINKKSVVVRYMFFNRDDIDYYKPLELRTKWGKRGHIKQALGTHGHMKCTFNGQLRSEDTVSLNLYKRMFPPWSFVPNVNILSPHIEKEETIETTPQAFQMFD